MPAKRWPLERFLHVIGELISEFDIWPVIFGGEEDRVIGAWLLDRWGSGYNAAGALGIRSSLAAMKHCELFIGNDTGTMHMAAAVGLPCVAIFSSRERPGLWYPPGEGHRVFRSAIECEGCGLVECLELGNECLKRISVEGSALCLSGNARNRRLETASGCEKLKPRAKARSRERGAEL
jgi:ADP-heptose:LPS heptosyltransferase